MASNSKISINEQHDYITLKLPAGNFTVSRNGAKVSGRLAIMDGAFKAYGDAMRSLNDQSLLDSLVPGWDVSGDVDLSAGDTVRFTVDAFKKRYPESYVVKAVKGKSAVLSVVDKGRAINLSVQTIYLEKI